jgi:hypothetical protein
MATFILHIGFYNQLLALATMAAISATCLYFQIGFLNLSLTLAADRSSCAVAVLSESCASLSATAILTGLHVSCVFHHNFSSTQTRRFLALGI